MDEKRSFKEAMETKLLNLKAAGHRKLQEANVWVGQHKDEIVTFGPIVLAGGTAIIKAAVRGINLHRQESLKNLYCYDRSLGHYWKLKRRLSNREWLAIENRRKRGERLSDILSSMNVLK